jgi:hypothetical protein
MADTGKAAPGATRRPLLVIGWIEHLDLPQLGLLQIKVKVDTGARTSALHATAIQTFFRDGAEWVRFHVPLGTDDPGTSVEAQVHDRREIKNTSGIPEERITIRTRMRLAGRVWTIPVSLADRSEMRFPMIIGRTALKGHNIAVHTRRANLTRPDTDPKETR